MPHLVQSGGILSVKIVFHLHNFTIIFYETLFKFRCHGICNKNNIAYSTVFGINLIDTIVNNYITIQEQWKMLGKNHHNVFTLPCTLQM